MQQLQEGMVNPAPTTDDQRATLGDLRARGKLQKVGTNRTGAAKLGKWSARMPLSVVVVILTYQEQTRI